MTRLLDILDDYCRYRGYKYCRIDGQTSAIDRELRIEDFQFEGSDKFIFLLSTRAGGIGINLHAANTVIIYDSDWNPQVDLQAIDRAHRIGQKREVVIYRFVTDGSVEEKIVERAAKKLKIDHLIMQKGRFSNDTTKVSDKEMVQIIQFGAKKILANEKGLINEENIDELLKYGVEKTEHLNHELKKFENKYSLNNFSINDEEQNMYVFEGEDYKKKRKEVEPILETKIEFIDIGSRERKATSYDINQYYRTALNNNTAPPKEKKKLTGWRAKANGGYKHQFFDISKLDQLEEKERAWKEFQELKKEDEKLVMKSPPRYTEKDANLIDKLLAEGFPNWSKKDFYSYIHGCEKWTRDNYEKIAEEMKSKPPEEVEEYSQVFWKRWNEIENGERYVERIKKGEADMKKQSEIENVLNFKFSKLTNEGNNTLLDNIHIEYNKNAKTTSYSNEEDKMIAFCLYKYGYGSWELMRNEIRNSEQFRYTYNYLNSRSNVELQRRSDHLISLFKKESEEKAKTKQQKQQKLGKSRNGKLMIEVPADKIKSKSRQAKGSKEDSKPVKKVLGKRKASIKDDKKKSKRAKASGSKPEAKIEIKKGKKDDNAEDEEVGEFESQSSYTP